MDPLTHGLTGALLGKAFFSERHGRTASVALTLGALFPDSDISMEFFAPNALATLAWHRGVTHSFLGLPVFAVLLAGLTRTLLRRRPAPGFAGLFLLYGLGMAVHIFLDLITSFGTMIWSPLSSARVAWDWVFILDLVFTGIVLLPQVMAWIYREPGGALRRGVLTWLFLSVCAAAAAAVAALLVEAPFPARLVLGVSALIGILFLLPGVRSWGFWQARRVFCRIGVAALAGYLALCAACHHLALGRVKAFAARKNLAVESWGALPAPPWVFHWSGLVLTPAGVHQREFSLLGAGEPEFAFHPHAAPNRYIELAERLPAVKTFRWFARFPLVSYRAYGIGAESLHIVEYTDLRFSLRVRRRRNPPAFTYRVLLNAAGDVGGAGFVDN